jgi:excisionase family DNA binding protein
MYSVRQAAERLGVSQSTIYGAIERGLLECYRLRSHPDTRGVIRISEEQLARFLEASRAEPDGPAPAVSLRDIRYRGPSPS